MKKILFLVYKILISILLITQLLLLNGCGSKTIGIMGIENTFSSVVNTFDFMKSSDYEGKDITNAEYVSNKDEKLMKLTIKNVIDTTISMKINEKTYEVNIIAKSESDIEDIINCTSFAIKYENREKDYPIIKGAISEALRKTGEKIEMPIYSSIISSEKIESYVQVLNGAVYIIYKVALD